MEDDQSGVTFVLKIDENGRHIYTLQPTGERYELDEENQEMIEIQESGLGLLPSKRIKLEQPELDPLETPVITEMEDDEVGEEVEHEVLLAEEGVPEVHTPADPEICVASTYRKRKQMETETVEGLITQNTDIQAPLSSLKSLLERRFQVKLDGYEFWLQDKQMLESHRTLVEQCVQGEGIVQVNLQIKVVGDSRRINIEDVLKPADEYSEMLGESLQMEDEDVPDQPPEDDQPNSIVRWIVDSQFKKEAERLKIPQDPFEWTMPHVRHWLQWAVRQFNLVGLKLSDWQMTGHDLCNLSLVDFKAKVKSDPCDIFWTHLELLRKCKFVAVVQNKDSMKNVGQTPAIGKSLRSRLPKPGKVPQKVSRVIGMPLMTEYSGNINTMIFGGSPAGNRTGNNGQVQLWQFLLELLTDKEHRHVIQWIGNEGEFKLVNPETVARLWGERKNKPTMNYEKLSRALRYYYDGDMISKVHGKRFVYKYVCDLKQLIGYSPDELNRLCAEAALNSNIILPLEELNYEEC